MKKKVIIIAAIVVAAVVLFTPVPTFYKDGGSKVFRSLTYTVYSYNRIVDAREANKKGVRIEIFGIKVFDNFNEDGEVCLKSDQPKG